MVSIDRTDAEERLARIDEMIEKYRAMKHRQALQRAMKRWRRTETHQHFAALEAQPERTH